MINNKNIFNNNKTLQTFETNVILKYQIYNGLFLSLPFNDIDQAGARLSIFSRRCEDGLKAKLTPKQIVETYLNRVNIPKDRHFDLLFKFIQFIERQILLFDALEDATFANTNNLNGEGSINDFLHKVTNNKTEIELYELLNHYKTRIVLTAHPTQFYPNTILGIILNMGKAIKENNLNDIQNLFLQMGLTRFTNTKKPTPLDEAKSLIWYLENVLYKSIPKIQEKLYSIRSDTCNIELGFWPGGDRDGNPFVTANVTIEVAELLKNRIAILYLNDLMQLRFHLTFEGIYDELLKIIDKLKTCVYKLPNELINDLLGIKKTLIHKYCSLYLQELEELIIKVKIFGFHFVTLDIRQNSKIHQNVVSFILAQKNICPEYLTLSEEEKVALLIKHKNDCTLIDDITTDDGCCELINTLFAIHKIQKTNGNGAIERYIISNTCSMANIFEVLFLIELVNTKIQMKAHSLNEPLPPLIKLEIVPLFETINDLICAKQIMEDLFNNSIYVEQLNQHNRRQTIMLGFSDGTKDGGYLMSNWSIYSAKKELSILCKKYNINVIFFDGRGGPPSRGGGNTRDFYHSMGKNIDMNEIQLTIQGQTIYSNFGTEDSSIYNIEQLFTSGLTAKLHPNKSENITVEQENIIETLAKVSYQHYTDLKNAPLFIPYLEEISTLKFLAETNIGSRPAKRNTDDALKFEDLRAIPFVGAWAQLKQNILGYYGLGFAINTYVNNNLDGLTTLQQLYKDSLFFKTLLDNSMQSLAKSNLEITEYLGNDIKFGSFWQTIKNESRLANEMLLKVSQQQELLEDSKITNKSIEIREKIILPLLIIQQYAMMKLREDEIENKELLEKLVKKTLVANINASRNSI